MKLTFGLSLHGFDPISTLVTAVGTLNDTSIAKKQDEPAQTSSAINLPPIIKQQANTSTKPTSNHKKHANKKHIPTLEELFNKESQIEAFLQREKKIRKFVSIGTRTITIPVYQQDELKETKPSTYSNTRIVSNAYPFVPMTESGTTYSQLGQKFCQAIYTTITRLRAQKRIKKLKEQSMHNQPKNLGIAPQPKTLSKLELLEEYAKTLDINSSFPEPHASNETQTLLFKAPIYETNISFMPAYATPRNVDLIVNNPKLNIFRNLLIRK